MRLLILITLAALPLSAQIVVDDQFTVQPGAVEPIREYLETNFLEEADTDENGAISNAEAVAWFSSKRQETADTFSKNAIDEAVAAYRADQTLTTLDADSRSLLDALIAAEAAWQARYDALVSGP